MLKNAVERAGPTAQGHTHGCSRKMPPCSFPRWVWVVCGFPGLLWGAEAGLGGLLDAQVIKVLENNGGGESWNWARPAFWSRHHHLRSSRDVS